jgi:hypothetical protein
MYLKNLSYDEAERIAEKDGLYFIRKYTAKYGNKWNGRHCDRIYLYPICELIVNRDLNGKPDRTGQSGFTFDIYVGKFTVCDNDVDLEIVSIPQDECKQDDLPYLQIKTKHTSFYPSTILLYPIEVIHAGE